MSLKIINLMLIAVAFIANSCSVKSVLAQAQGTSTLKPVITSNADDETPLIEQILGREEKLTYKDFVVEKHVRKVKDDFGSGSKPLEVDVAYAVLKQKEVIVAKFDGNIYFGMGNAISFGFFPLLGGHEKQLIVNQDVPRGGAQWIADLSSKPKVIFDGQYYRVGREGLDLGIEDIDGDGVYEIIAPMTLFYGFSDWILPPMATPMPSAIFKYDVNAKKYLPANPQFENYLLKDIDEKKARTDSSDNSISRLGEVLDIVLTYIMVGKEREAWSYFDNSYTFDVKDSYGKMRSKTKIEAEIKSELQRHPVYRFIYKNRAK